MSTIIGYCVSGMSNCMMTPQSNHRDTFFLYISIRSIIADFYKDEVRYTEKLSNLMKVKY